jgi:hypothetical protein
MSLLSAAVDDAVGSVIAENPKLFAAHAGEKAQAALTRAIMKKLVREARPEEGERPPEPTAAAQLIPADDPRAVAYCGLRRLAGDVPPQVTAGGAIYLPPEADTAQVRALNDTPPRADWPFVTGGHLAAWLDFFDAALIARSRRKITETKNGHTGAYLPWPWPPSKDGKTYAPAADLELTDE